MVSESGQGGGKRASGVGVEVEDIEEAFEEPDKPARSQCISNYVNNNNYNNNYINNRILGL